MFLDGALTRATDLVNGRSITQAQRIETDFRYIHVELNTHDILVANGAASESYVERKNRNRFQNVSEFLALYPDSQPRKYPYCALRLTTGETFEAIVQKVTERAEQFEVPEEVFGALDRTASLASRAVAKAA